jgi:chromosome segregation ATPase
MDKMRLLSQNKELKRQVAFYENKLPEHDATIRRLAAEVAGLTSSCQLHAVEHREWQGRAEKAEAEVEELRTTNTSLAAAVKGLVFEATERLAGKISSLKTAIVSGERALQETKADAKGAKP